MESKGVISFSDCSLFSKSTNMGRKMYNIAISWDNVCHKVIFGGRLKALINKFQKIVNSVTSAMQPECLKPAYKRHCYILITSLFK